MPDKPLVTVVIPCYNHGKFIEAAIDSVKLQPYDNTEIIVIDDGSTDTHTLEVLSKIASKVTVVRQANQGPSIARNVAIKQSKGEYILALDSDNKIRPNFISTAVEYLNSNPETGVVYGDFQYYGDKTDIKKQLEFDIKKQLNNNIFDMCAVFRRKVFDDVGGFDEFMSKPGLEDWDFWISVYEKGWKFKHIPEIFFDYYIAETSRTFQVANKNIEVLQVYVWKKHASLLAQQYQILYHENKNFFKSMDYKIGSLLLKPFRKIKNILR
jgi:glycosyltransferase involved in cell wall biosynthesis